MLRAVMIDGFGWFQREDFLRAWLLFDEVDYVFPAEVRGNMLFPALFRPDPRFHARQFELTAEDMAAITHHLERDAASQSFRSAVARVPDDDAAYARQVVAADGQVRHLLTEFEAVDPVPALSILSTKLLLAAQAYDAVPIVGKEYAWSLIGDKLGEHTFDWATHSRANCAAFAAGLSLQAIGEATVAGVDLARLQRFKHDHASLLERHQLRLLEVANDYTGLPHGSDFERAVQSLQIEAQRHRMELDQAWTCAWRDAGLRVLNRGMTAATLSAIPAIMLVRDTTWNGLMQAALAPTLATVGVVATELIDVAKDIRRARAGAMTYLFEANRLLR